MPKKKIVNIPRAPTFIIRALRRLANEPKAHPRYRLQAIDRLAKIQGLYTVELGRPEVVPPPPVDVNAEVDIKNLLQEFNQKSEEINDAASS